LRDFGFIFLQSSPDLPANWAYWWVTASGGSWHAK